MLIVFCSRCQCDDVRRVARQGFLERLVYPWLHLRPFLCGKCGRRFAVRIPKDLIRETPSYDDVYTTIAN